MSHREALNINRLYVVFLFAPFVCLCGIFPLSLAHSRVSYSAHTATLSCTACHVSPTGGGIQNVDGKIFGLHEYPFTGVALQDLYQFDFRSVFYTPENLRTDRGGFGLMELLAAVNFPVEGKNSRTHFVAAYNFGIFMAGLRETFLLWKIREDRRRPGHILVGRFSAPFGILTDEHRTFVRVQTRTTHNDFQMGVLAADEISPTLHYDVALVNGFQSSDSEGSGRFSMGLTAGGFLNLRWMPSYKPWFLGISGSYFSRHSGAPNPYGVSTYGVVSLDRFTKHRLPFILQTEAVASRHWNDFEINPELRRLFFPGEATATTDVLEDQTAIGVYGEVDALLDRHWTLIYKLDRLDFSTRNANDTFTRHGFGARYFASAGATVQVRYELAITSIPDELRDSLAAQDAGWLLLHYRF
jgi:hypothetical protein